MEYIGIKLVKLVTQRDIAELVGAVVTNCKSKVWIKHNEYVVNARSILGVLSLDCSQSLAVLFETQEDYDVMNDVLSKWETDGVDE